ncbi:response regulator transcription factor [Sulfitobacter sp. D35]|uniref:response regulator transcription factor n=1 Tax=Sulfitobacter sp. D35 TaxID=3083252 RepID=UPI00296EE120|nr:response regulator transcription factor [Sulfitobacter sp. D35]MDW4497678.1 response regulator transcription factor [Sulfitobacter sp. D35]
MTEATRVKVLVVDDHPMVAEGIQSILESYDDLDVLGTCNSGHAVIEALDQAKPDVILMDLNMPGMGGLAATEIVLERRPETRILILSMHDNAEYISTALSHGAMGYVLKDVPTDEIKQAIDAVMAGERYLCTGAKGSLEPQDGAAREALTGREQTILLQLAQGRSNKDVAQALEISVRTVETHRKNIKRKLGISSTAGLTRYALEHGVLQGTGANFRARG